MTHTPTDVRERLDRECNFPAPRAAVVDAVGDVELTAPNGDSVTVGAVLERADETEYASLSELHNTILTYLDDDHVGRSEYDDRAANPSRDDEVSF